MKKNGFTLIELLAVMVIIIIVVGLGAPVLINVLKNNKKKADEKIMEIVESAARSYMIDYDSTMVCIAELCDKAYLSCPITNVSTNQSIDECIAFSNADGTENYIYGTPSIPLKIDLNGGEISNNLSGSYISGMTLILPTPTKFLSNFSGWQVTSGTNSRMIDDNVIFIGSTATSVEAIWDANSYLITYNCSGGIGNNLVQRHMLNSQLADNMCSKIVEGTNGMVYYFKGWSSHPNSTTPEYSNNATVSAVEMQDNRATLYAVWGNLFDIVGNYEVIDDDNGNWRVKIKGSIGNAFGNASIKFNINALIDAFFVGGGNTSGWSGYASTYLNINIADSATIHPNVSYTVKVGNAAEQTYFIDTNEYYANGGSSSSGGSSRASTAVWDCKLYDANYVCLANSCQGGSLAGSYGNSQYTKTGYPWSGQTTCEFNEGTLTGCTKGSEYAYAGGGSSCSTSTCRGYGGGVASGGIDNKGGGANCGGTAGTGIAIFRNARL